METVAVAMEDTQILSHSGRMAGAAPQFHNTDKDDKGVYLFHVRTVAIKRHVKVKGNANPYDPVWEM